MGGGIRVGRRHVFEVWFLCEKKRKLERILKKKNFLCSNVTDFS